MHTLKWRMSSAVISLGVAGIIGSGIIAAQAAETQTAETPNVPVLSMPAGDHRTAPDTALSVLMQGPRLSPTPAAELERLKNLPADGDAPDNAGEAADAALGVEPRAILRNCEMNVATGFAPSDVHGAAAPANIIEVTNVDIMVRNKTNCALVSSMSLKTFFGGAGGFIIPETETLFDPRVLFDRLHGRCIVTVESRNSGNTDQFLYIASSRTNSCTTWRRIRFVLSRVEPFARFCKNLVSDFYDFPNAGYNFRRLVVTSNNFPTAGSSYGTLLSINKIALHGTAVVTGRCFRPISGNSTPAVQGDAGTSMIILSTGSGSGTVLGRRRLTAGAATTNDTLTTLSSINITDWTAPPDAVQPNGQKLDTLDGRFQSASKQIGSVIWNVHAIRSGNVSRVRLYKLSTSGTTPLFVKSLFTTSCGGSNQHTFNPSLDTNSAASGSPLFVTTSRTCTAPATAAVGRAAHLLFKGPNNATNGWNFNTVATSLGEFSNLGFVADGVACNTTGGDFRGSCRWGDYSSTQIDPSTPTTAWGFNQLITTGEISGTGSQFNWTTRGARRN